MRCAILFTGGKDSTLAMHQTMAQGGAICCLAVFLGGSPRGLFHTLDASFVEKAAEAMCLPLVPFRLSGNEHSEIFEVQEAFTLLEKQYGIQAVVSGSISPGLRFRQLQSVCQTMGLQFLAPLLGQKRETVLMNALKNGFTVLPVRVSAKSAAKELLGKSLDRNAMQSEMELRRSPSPILGSMVLDGPTFSKRIRILRSTPMWDALQGLLVMESIELEEK